jgi:hypothetical protein
MRGGLRADKNAGLISIGETEISSWRRAPALHEGAGKPNKTRNLYSQLERCLSRPPLPPRSVAGTFPRGGRSKVIRFNTRNYFRYANA